MNREAAIISRTYRHTLTARRPAIDGEWVLLCQEEPCALSRAAQVSAPAPPDAADPLPESRYRYALFTRPELIFRLGDRLEISDGVRLYTGRASDSFFYPSHTVTVVEIRQVEEKGRTSLT